MRVGIGVDIHPLSDERKLILGGVIIEGYPGLLGHSDGDVLIHALIDALLGAAGLPDIGHFFPETPQWKGASGLNMLKIVAKKIEEMGFGLLNADLSILIEKPLISPFREEILKNLQSVFPKASFSIKATTSEGLGFVGKKEGACAFAAVLLEGP